MPTSSEQKVRVSRLFGSDAYVGALDPKIDMQVRRGTDTRWVVSTTSGNYLCNLAKASGGAVVNQAYPHELFVSKAVAEYFGWPDSVDSVTFGRKKQWPNGVPVASGVNTMTYFGGDGLLHPFSR